MHRSRPHGGCAALVPSDLHATRTRLLPIQVAARAKPWVCGRSLSGNASSKPAGLWMSVVSVVGCQVEVYASGRSLVQRSSTEYGMCVSVIVKPRYEEALGHEGC